MNVVKESFRSDHAEQYDRRANESKWLDPAIVFGLAYAFVKPNDSVLDIGIGTGLSSELFFKAGLRIYGMDSSPDMLSLCRAKKIAVDLKEHDLSDNPYPYEPGSIHHAICTGVTHLFKDLNPIFRGVVGILKNNGTFSFVVADCDDDEARERTIKNCHHREMKNISMHRYSTTDIQELLVLHHFKLVHDLLFSASSIGNQLARYRAYVVQKTAISEL
jgi:predicted TPR repeat methyltransferase